MSKLRVFKVRMTEQPGSALRVYNLKLTGLNQVTPNLGADRTVDSRVTVALTATVTGTATAWVWSQTAGPTVTLTGSGGARSFTAPATVDGATLTFTVTATVDTVPSNPGTVTVRVRAHQWWIRRNAGTWAPMAQPVRLS